MIHGLLDEANTNELETPAVVVDLALAEARIAGMASWMLERGIALRPHAKTHKSIEFGRRQIEAGAVGLTVATIGEAEVFADAGILDLFIAFPVIAEGSKGDRLRRLAERSALSVGVDSSVGVDALSQAVRDASRQPSVLIEIDCGGGRTGVRPALAGALARQAANRGLEVAGVFTHGGHSYAGIGAPAAAAADEMAGLAAAADSLRAEGIDPIVISAGSTPTSVMSAAGVVNEERPGTYIFGDRQQAALAGTPFDDTALMVAATVVSPGPRHGFVIDAGAKILAKDVAPFLEGHGSVLGYPDAVIERVNDHHGVVELPAGSARPAIGSIVWVMPNHVCPVVNLVDEYVVASGGRILGRWPVDARGRNT